MADTPDAIELDLGSFTGHERRELQRRFDNQFQDLTQMVVFSIARTRSTLGDFTIPALEDGDGQRVLADEVIMALVATVRRRTDPDFDEADLEDLAFAELIGLVQAPKARTGGASKQAKT